MYHYIVNQIQVSYDNNKNKDIVFRGILAPVHGVEVAGYYYSGKTNEEEHADDVAKTGGSLYAHNDKFTYLSEYITSKTGNHSKEGYFLMLGYGIKTAHPLFTKLMPLVRYDYFDLDTEINGDSKTRVTLGLNVYFHNKYNKLQVNYQINNEEAHEHNNNEFIVALQFSLH